MTSPPNQPIALRPMRHQSFVQRPKEDWAGITDQKTRKKLQNRLNQRARRSRQPPPKTVDNGAAAAASYTNKEEATKEEEDDDDELIARVVVQKRARLARFALEATQSYVTNRPDTDQLLRVVKLNTINALTANATALQLPGDWLMCRAISPIGLAGPLLPAPVTTAGGAAGGAGQRQRQRCCYPASLTPTPLQLRIPHHPWIDVLPLPRMRDNWLLAIYVQGRLTEEDEVRLWEDLVEWDGGGGRAAASLVVWGEPSDPRSWEATVPFLRQWGRLLDGCDEILEATNYWRRSRGERCLLFPPAGNSR